jgi:hypothetical protein
VKKKKRYANAKDVLPEELFEQIQKHYTGILWVPAPSRFYQERRDLVLALHLQGISSQEISNLAGVTTRRVNRLSRPSENRIRPDRWTPFPVCNRRTGWSVFGG